MVNKGLTIGLPDSIETPTHIALTGSLFGATEVRTTQLITTGSAQAVGLSLPTISTGSPEALGDIAIQIGRSGTGAGSAGWINFNKLWSAAPAVFVTSAQSGTVPGLLGSTWVGVGSVGVGSFFIVGSAVNVNWMAVGAR